MFHNATLSLEVETLGRTYRVKWLQGHYQNVKMHVHADPDKKKSVKRSNVLEVNRESLGVQKKKKAIKVQKKTPRFLYVHVNLNS